jgi:Ets-domain
MMVMLVDDTCRDVINWTGNEWEFEVFKPNELAKRWGAHKDNPLMTYYKLTQTARNYYDRGIMRKVPNKLHTYQFMLHFTREDVITMISETCG